eukprot:CAMPEP_0202906898 /NCGR_PEP_ID=MMETSP1392-20130828/40640_1 /ASSEMBLY_ACC=CAM_ASM_000868 /TAXON_ID=225041 /ORGANISM="Chlamydomonas chlamydogama, Strain SAG 11-48b" /LENGTH=196 /DNA_ID=CAMNT_0049595581 /DNA_START=47 /DNA_END=634 /DNA_ORIENTATION=+
MQTITAAVSSRNAGVKAEEEGELFAILDSEGHDLGITEYRHIVHAKGLYHRAVYCFVFNSKKELLIQRRSWKKKVGPSQWDLSVAEHLQPGESYRDAVVRGLNEELGIEMSSCLHSVVGPLSATHLRKLELPSEGIHDYEFVESYRLDNYEGRVTFNEEEVSAVRFAKVSDIQHEMQENPDNFTVWFREELNSLNW